MSLWAGTSAGSGGSMRASMLRVVRWMKGSSSRAAGSLWKAVSSWIRLNTRRTDSCTPVARRHVSYLLAYGAAVHSYMCAHHRSEHLQI